MVDKFAYAAMLNTGNFILVGKDFSPVWESFGEQADTILPMQVMELDCNLALNPVALPTKTAYSAYYVSGTNDAANESNSGYLNVIRRNGNIENLTTGSIPLPKDFFYRATLDGIFTRFQQMEAIGLNYGPIFGPSRMIFVPTLATISAVVFVGSTATAELSLNRRLICHCLLGFSLPDPDDKFSGCKQDYVQTCDPNAPNSKKLYKMKTLKILVWRTSAIYEALIPSNKDDCCDACISDCNCVIAITYSGSCWKKKLPLTSGWKDISSYGTVFIKIPKANVTSKQLVPSPETITQKDQATAINPFKELSVPQLPVQCNFFDNILLLVPQKTKAHCDVKYFRNKLTMFWFRRPQKSDRGDLVPLPVGRRAVGCKWIFKVKRHANGSVARYKRRLVVKGYLQEVGVDFLETFSPVVMPATIRVILALAVSLGLSLRQVDINNAFLNGGSA
ncbi:G-type lectin S-receptor-like serine/threonine-protein kinase RLK1 [Gossypium australe]|uniref:G-type lectin S-receptor-like serine/threonine-protein kinase RLK1 n=1 Tax=Gossypium australe TaxID=47621 RepID=A0A5B6V7L6_9ROSI|nr:G-type lectin S-receptor-like serine/threonine-protein kinase RLK1 [Gossypium australe]